MSQIERLDRTKHNRLPFSCGKEPLDRFLHETAQQAFSKNVAATYVASDPNDPHTILGYYSVSNFQLDAGVLPDTTMKKFALPNGRLPATLIGRLAVASSAQGQGLGSELLMDALTRCYLASRSVASTSIVVDALDDDVVPFYEQYGFIRVAANSRRLFLMMQTVEQLPSVQRRLEEHLRTQKIV